MQQFERLFSYLQLPAVPHQIRTNILECIAYYRVRNARLALVGSVSALFVSVWGLYSASTLLLQELAQSGLFQYASLLFSDTSLLATYAKDFSYLILESLPVVALIGVGVSLFALIVFFRSTLLTFKEALPVSIRSITTV